MLDLDDIADVIAGAVREATQPLLARIDALEKRELLLPEKGEPGEAGPQGEPGIVDMAAVKALIDDAVSALPVPDRGEPGAAGEKGEAGEPGRDGLDGKDGAGIADALIDREGNLVLTLTDGRTKALGLVVGKDGANGRDGSNGAPGRDGITPTFLDADFVGRTLRLSFDEGRTCEFQLAVPEYCGVFKEGEDYAPGDVVTWAGSAWHCNEPKGMKPGAPDSGWTLMVKAGRPGKDAGK